MTELTRLRAQIEAFAPYNEQEEADRQRKLRLEVIKKTHLHLNATYLLEADDKSPIRCKPDENSAVRWLSAQDVLPSVSGPAMRPVYQKLMEKAARQT